MSRWKSSGASSYDPPFPTSNKKPPESEIRGLFEALDKDGNGYIDRNELRSTMMEVGLNLTEKDVNTMMQVASVPIKDRIFYEDFVKMMAGRIGHSQRRALYKKREAQGPSTYTICEGEEEDRDIQAMRVAFSMFDHDGDGLISVQEVLDTMTSLGIIVTFKEVKQIVKRVDLDGDGSINFDEFCLAIRKYQSNPIEDQSTNQSHANLEMKGPLRTQELAEAFKVFDKDKDGYLNADDLKNTMQQLGLTLTEGDLRAMMKSAKIGPSGKISFTDFCRIYSNQSSLEGSAAQKKLNENRKTFTNKLTKQQEIAEIRAVFYLFDMDRDGFITKDEVEEVLLSMGVPPSQECISHVFNQVDLDGNGKIDFDEFLLLVRTYERPLPEEVEAREMFKAMDRDGNGFVDTLELKASFGALGVPLSDEDVKIMMEEANIKTNKIFFKDFLRIMSGKFGASFSQNTSFDSECSLDLNFHNFSSRDKTKSKTLTRQHAHERVMDNLEESEKEELMAAQESQFEEMVEERIETVAERRSKMLTASANATSFEVQDFFKESLNPELTPASLLKVYDLSSAQQNIPQQSKDQQQQRQQQPQHHHQYQQQHEQHHQQPQQHKKQQQQQQQQQSTTSPTNSQAPSSTSSSTAKTMTSSKNIQQRTCLAKGTPPSTWVAFKVFDRNADGYISKSELYRTMIELGINLSKEDLEAMMIKADINKDGRIDYAEFSKLMMGSFEVYAKQAAQLSEKRSSSTASSSEHGLQTTTFKPHQHHHHHQQQHHSPSSFHSNGTAISVGKTHKGNHQGTLEIHSPPQRCPTDETTPQNTQNHVDLHRHIQAQQQQQQQPQQQKPQPQSQQSQHQHQQPQQPQHQQHTPQQKQPPPQQQQHQPQQQQPPPPQQQKRCNRNPIIRLKSTEDEMRTAFRIFDIDDNGLIDAEELKQTMLDLDEVLSDKDVESMILAVDKNGDGKVDYEEFLQLLRFTRTDSQTSS